MLTKLLPSLNPAVTIFCCAEPHPPGATCDRVRTINSLCSARRMWIKSASERAEQANVESVTCMSLAPGAFGEVAAVSYEVITPLGWRLSELEGAEEKRRKAACQAASMSAGWLAGRQGRRGSRKASAGRTPAVSSVALSSGISAA